MNNDCISRHAAIDALLNHYEVRNTAQNKTMDECVMIIRDLPSAQQCSGWISVREKLPEDNTTVLVTHNSGRVSISSWHASTVRTMGFDNPGVLFNTETGEIRTDGVMAWMPLPEPYKEEKT